jgi:hypothetical protein
MRHVVAFVLIVIACVCVPARPAEAQGVFLEWLERLSGPGPLKGPGAHLVFHCYGVRTLEPRQTDPKAASESPEPFFDFGCAHADRNRVRVSVGAQVATATGPLLDDDDFPEAQDDTIRATSVLATVDIGLRRSVEVGFGAGFVRFSSLPVSSFTRLSVQPVRVIWKPLVTFGQGATENWREALQLRFTASMFPDGFSNEDFGSPVPFESGKEIQGSFVILVDLLAAVGR